MNEGGKDVPFSKRLKQKKVNTKLTFLNNARKEKTLINVLRQTGSKESESSLQTINRISYHLVDKIFSIQQRVMSGTAKLSLSLSQNSVLSTCLRHKPVLQSHFLINHVTSQALCVA